MAKIKDVADSHNVGILLIHHTRKEVSEDVFDTVLGTTGITGAADTVIILVKKKSTGNLHVSGRDVEDATFAMKFDRKTLSWILDDDALKYTLTPEKKAIYKLLEKNGHPMQLKDIAHALDKKVSNIGHMLKDDVFDKTNYGEYTINKE
jgi:RecA-family ATPase